MAASGRVRRSIRFAQLDAQADTAVRDTALRRERMNLNERLEMPAFQNTQDWTGGMGVNPSGLFQVPREGIRKKKPFSREGIRSDWAHVLLLALVAVMCVALLVQVASIGAENLRIRKLEARIEKAQENGRALRTQLEQSSGDISVCTRAVELNLISSGGAPTIRLTAPSGATLMLVERPVAEATGEPEMRASLGNLN